MKNDWEYVALCLIVPLVWGILSARVFDWLESRRPARAVPAAPDRAEGDDPEMYYI